MPTLTAVVSGDLITDAVRAAGLAGDGRTGDSSYGIYFPRTNLIPNSEGTGAATYQSVASGTVTADATTAKFGTTSVKFTPAAGSAGGILIQPVGRGFPLLLSSGAAGLAVLPSTTYTMSVWARATTSLSRAIRATMKAFTSTGVALADAFTNQSFTPPSSGVWTRFQWTFTTGATAAFVQPIFNDGGGVWTGTDVWWLNAAQLEKGTFASPYIPTPSVGSRATPRVQIQPVGNSRNGTVAMRFRPAFDGPAGTPNSNANARLWSWADDATHRIELLYNASTHQWQLVIQNGATTNTVSVAATHTAGQSITLFASWDQTGACRISLNGGALVSNTVAGATPTLSATQSDVGSGGTITANSFAEGDVLWQVLWNTTLSQQSDANAIGALTDLDPPSLAGLPSGASLLWPALTSSYSTTVAAARALTDTGLTQTDTLVKTALGPVTSRTLADTGLTVSDSILVGRGTRVSTDSYADGASASFGAVSSTNTGKLSMFADSFDTYAAPADETATYYGRLPLTEAQTALASTPIEQGTADNVNCCWHGQLIDAERGSIFIVRAGGELEDRIGRRVRISVRGVRGKEIVGFVHGVADLDAQDEISVPRRLFMELALPGLDRVPVTVESLQT